jgi:hypothetical protein
MDNMIREAFLNTLIGRPYKKNAKGPEAYDCWHVAVHVEDVMFGRIAPNIEVPENLSWPWLIQQFKTHPELDNWVEVLQPPNGLITAADGAMVLMARNKQPAHCGVYFQRERSVLHADERDGVVFQDIPTLKMNSWAKLRFYEPR